MGCRHFEICFAVLAIVAVVGQAGGQTAEATKPAEAFAKPAPTPQEAANEFISLLQQEKFADAAKQFDATMQKALSAEQLQAVWRQRIQVDGPFKEVGLSRVNRVQQWDVVDTPCTFEKSSVVVRIALDKDLRVSGLFFIPAPKPPKPGDGTAVELKTASGTLHGTLDLPTGQGPWPVVLIVAGSGPTDRDGNQPQLKNDSLKLLGKSLASHGVAALRYDKRGVAASAAAGAVEENLRFENYVEDAAAWVKQLRGDQRFNRVFFVGHSEGSLVGILAAKREKIDGLVSIAGSGRELATLLRDQLKRNLPANLLEQSSRIIDELVAGRRVASVPDELTVLFRPSVQPYLITWLKYNPATEIAELKIPILVVQGTTDLQTSVEDAKLLVAGNRGARLVTIENMNHVLKNTPSQTLAEQIKVYSDPSLPLAGRLVDEVLGFVQAK